MSTCCIRISNLFDVLPLSYYYILEKTSYYVSLPHSNVALLSATMKWDITVSALVHNYLHNGSWLFVYEFYCYVYKYKTVLVLNILTTVDICIIYTYILSNCVQRPFYFFLWRLFFSIFVDKEWKYFWDYCSRRRLPYIIENIL